MKKGCLLWLLQLAVLTGLYYLALRGRISPGDEWLGALGGGVALFLVIAAFRVAWSARQGRALLGSADTGAPFEDGQRIAAVGPILALSSPVPAPLSGDPCVFCAWRISHKNPSHMGKSRPQDVNDFSGFIMTSCVVQAPTGNVRILGFPVLEDFPEEVRRGDAAFARAEAYLSSTSFEKVGATNVFSQVKDLLVEEDGHLRKDWRMAGDDFQLEPRMHTLNEQVVRDGETVCALRLYSAERKGLVPGYGQGGHGIKLIRGDSAAARKTLSGTFWKYVVVGTVLFVVTHFLLFNFVRDRGSEIRVGKKEAREAAFFQAVEEGDLAAVTAELDAGFDPNHRDQHGRTPLTLVEDPRVARRLILAGADVNARSDEGSTPLIAAAQSLNLELIRLLLQSGADVHARHYDLNALEWALQYHWEESYEEVVKVLREAGAKEKPP